MSIDENKLKNAVEAALMAFAQPLSVDKLLSLFEDDENVTRQTIKESLQILKQECSERGVELVEVASGFRYQAKQDYAVWVAKLWEEKPPRYSRALLETLVLVAYRQPITRGEIENIRGVSVSSHIMKTLQERDWVRVVGHKDVPGKPALYATTKGFLDYFNLKSLEELPPLSEIRDLDKINAELNAEGKAEGGLAAVEDNDQKGDVAEETGQSIEVAQQGVEDTESAIGIQSATSENQSEMYETPDAATGIVVTEQVDSIVDERTESSAAIVEENQENAESAETVSAIEEAIVRDELIAEPFESDPVQNESLDQSADEPLAQNEPADTDIENPHPGNAEPAPAVGDFTSLDIVNDDDPISTNYLHNQAEDLQLPHADSVAEQAEAIAAQDVDAFSGQSEPQQDSVAEEQFEARVIDESGVMEETNRNDINDSEFDQDNEFESNRATVAE